MYKTPAINKTDAVRSSHVLCASEPAPSPSKRIEVITGTTPDKISQANAD